MKLLNLVKVVTLASVLSFSSFANAALVKLLDFGELADVIGEGNVQNPFTFEDLLGISGFDVTITATKDGSGEGVFHYLDKGSGLGVCPFEEGCAKNPEDNANVGEGFVFEFMLDGIALGVEDFSILVVGHEEEGGIMEGTMVMMSDGMTFSPTNDMPVYTYAEGGDTFSFEVSVGEIYLGSIWIDDGSLPPQGIPEPANLALMALGLLGLVASRRKLLR